mmetsp:Transcript_32906/g.72681  ORF Transcript_32906/g.72681 Transcript_32906/m.72681 type:complete len:175 (-) Transcript_32906:851-1375(-)
MDELQKELKIRKRIVAIYNKRHDDFASKEDWDDYLEGIEDIIYNLANNIDVAATEQKVTEYERANRLNILANQARQVEELRKAQKAAADAALAPSADAKPSVPYGSAGAGVPVLIAAQPNPIGATRTDAAGNLLPPKAPASRSQLESFARASGWTPEIPIARAIQEAFGTVFAF